MTWRRRSVVPQWAASQVSAALTDAVPAGSVFLPLYYQGGIVNRLLHADGSPTTVTVRPV